MNVIFLPFSEVSIFNKILLFQEFLHNMEDPVGELLKAWNFEDYITNFSGTQISLFIVNIFSIEFS